MVQTAWRLTALSSGLQGGSGNTEAPCPFFLLGLSVTQDHSSWKSLKIFLVLSMFLFICWRQGFIQPGCPKCTRQSRMPLNSLFSCLYLPTSGFQAYTTPCKGVAGSSCNLIILLFLLPQSLLTIVYHQGDLLLSLISRYLAVSSLTKLYNPSALQVAEVGLMAWLLWTSFMPLMLI